MANSYSSYYNQVPYQYSDPNSGNAGSYAVTTQTASQNQYANYQAAFGDQYGTNTQMQYQQLSYQQQQQYQQPQQLQQQMLQAQQYQQPQSYQQQYQQSYLQQQATTTSQAYPYTEAAYQQDGNSAAYYNYTMADQQLSMQANKDQTLSALQALAGNASKKETDGEDEMVFGVDLSKQAPEEQQNHIQHQLQQQFQQAFEKQIHQQIHQMVLQQLAPHPVGNMETTGNFGEEMMGDRLNNEGVGLANDEKSKFYCSTCDINYANSLAFTSHLGSKEHKVQKERLDNDPVYREDFTARIQQRQQQQLMQQQQQSVVNMIPGKKQFHCRLCNITVTGAEMYAVHLKTFEHQQVLKVNRENKAKMALFVRPLQNVNFPMVNTDLSVPSKPAHLEPPSDGLGSEFIEELRDDQGQIIRVFCNLCKFDIDNEELKMLHLTGQKHSTLYKERMDKYQGNFMTGGGNIPPGGANMFAPPPMDAPMLQDPYMSFNKPPFNQPLNNPFFNFQPPPHRPYAPRLPYNSSSSFASSSHHRRSYSPYKGKSNNNNDDDDRYREEVDDADDLLVKEKHTLLYPTSKQFSEVRSMLAAVEKWLKQLQSKQHTSILHIKRINTVAKGLLSTTDMALDLLVLTSDWPTNSFVMEVYQNLKDTIEGNENNKGYILETVNDQSILVTMDNKEVDEDDDNKDKDTICCRINFASEASDKDDETEGKLSSKLVSNNLKQLKHTKWFQSNASPLPSCVMVLRVIKGVFKRHLVLGGVDGQLWELLMVALLQTHKRSTRAGEAFKFFLEALCQGVLMGGCDGDDSNKDNNKDNQNNTKENNIGGDGGDKGNNEMGEAGVDGEKKSLGGVVSEKDCGHLKYSLVLDETFKKTWWKMDWNKDDSPLLEITIEDKEFIVAEAEKMLELVSNGNLHQILGLEKKKEEEEKKETKINDNEDKINNNDKNDDEKDANNEQENGDNDNKDEDDDEDRPSKKRLKFPNEKQKEEN